jgi:hypothetical protein
MNTVHADGILHHHFWGEYCASIGLEFESPEAAADALTVLGEPWKVGEKYPNVLVCHPDSKGVSAIKKQLAQYGADPDKIDSLKYSVDRGEPFEITIHIVPKEQLPLF